MRNIAICAPATPLKRKHVEAVRTLAAAEFPHINLTFHDQCFVQHGHFAGTDDVRLAALLDCANDKRFDAIWFAKGGYGSNRIASSFLQQASGDARNKIYLGYSDCGTLLGALYRAGIGRSVHAPMPIDIKREGGEAAIRRVLSWMMGDSKGLEASLGPEPAAAFNLYTLAMLVGTRFMPPLEGHVLHIEEVGEYEYAIDRLLFHVLEHVRGLAGVRLGAVTHVPENDRPFGADPVEIVQFWCKRYDVPYLGRSQIGHTATNSIVPFGLEAVSSAA